MLTRQPKSAPAKFAIIVYKLNRFDGGSHHNSRIVAALETEKRFKRVSREEAFAMIDANLEQQRCR